MNRLLITLLLLLIGAMSAVQGAYLIAPQGSAYETNSCSFEPGLDDNHFPDYLPSIEALVPLPVLLSGLNQFSDLDLVNSPLLNHHPIRAPPLS